MTEEESAAVKGLKLEELGEHRYPVTPTLRHALLHLEEPPHSVRPSPLRAFTPPIETIPAFESFSSACSRLNSGSGGCAPESPQSPDRFLRVFFRRPPSNRNRL